VENAVMVGGATHEGHLFGDQLAFGVALCMAGMMAIIRRHSETPPRIGTRLGKRQ
jgi:hypothetical protein